MTEHQIQQREAQRQHLVAQDNQARRLRALELALAYEVECHAFTKSAVLNLSARLDALTRSTALDPAAVECDIHSTKVFCLFEQTEDGPAITAVHVAPGEDCMALLSRQDIDILSGQIADTLAHDHELEF